MNSESAAVHLIVRGKVQGVWYRAGTQEQAQKLDIAGWVRNLPDGSVEIQAEGLRENLDALIKWCRQGPPSAEVKDIDEEWNRPSGFVTFQIR